MIEGSSADLQIVLDHAPKTPSSCSGAPGETPVQVPLLNMGDARLAARLPAIAKEMQYQINAVDGEGMKLKPLHFASR